MVRPSLGSVSLNKQGKQGWFWFWFLSQTPGGELQAQVRRVGPAVSDPGHTEPRHLPPSGGAHWERHLQQQGPPALLSSDIQGLPWPNSSRLVPGNLVPPGPSAQPGHPQGAPLGHRGQTPRPPTPPPAGLLDQLLLAALPQGQSRPRRPPCVGAGRGAEG